MRLISAALLGAAAGLPVLVHATTFIPDPTDASASVPTVAFPSALDGYRPYSDADNATWQQLNQAVQDKPLTHGVEHGGGTSKPTGNDTTGHSRHTGANP